MGAGDYHDADASARVRKAANVRRANELRSDRIYRVRSGTLAFNSAAKTSSSASILAMVSGLILPTRPLGFFRFAMGTPAASLR